MADEAGSRRRVDILAHSLYREMKAQGFVASEIVNFASALLGQLIADFESRPPDIAVALSTRT
jgi:hypothetical protein